MPYTWKVMLSGAQPQPGQQSIPLEDISTSWRIRATRFTPSCRWKGRGWRSPSWHGSQPNVRAGMQWPGRIGGRAVGQCVQSRGREALVLMPRRRQGRAGAHRQRAGYDRTVGEGVGPELAEVRVVVDDENPLRGDQSI
jgi:hypothetical protein